MLILVVESAEIPEFRDISEDLLKHNIGVCANNAVAHQNCREREKQRERQTDRESKDN